MWSVSFQNNLGQVRSYQNCPQLYQGDLIKTWECFLLVPLLLPILLLPILSLLMSHLALSAVHNPLLDFAAHSIIYTGGVLLERLPIKQLLLGYIYWALADTMLLMDRIPTTLLRW